MGVTLMTKFGHDLDALLCFFYLVGKYSQFSMVRSKVFLLAQTMSVFINKTYKDKVDSNFLDKSLDVINIRFGSKFSKVGVTTKI